MLYNCLSALVIKKLRAHRTFSCAGPPKAAPARVFYKCPEIFHSIFTCWLFRAPIENILPIKNSGVYFPIGLIIFHKSQKTGLFDYQWELYTPNISSMHSIIASIWSVFPTCPEFSTIWNWTIWHQWELYTPIIHLQKNNLYNNVPLLT